MQNYVKGFSKARNNFAYFKFRVKLKYFEGMRKLGDKIRITP